MSTRMTIGAAATCALAAVLVAANVTSASGDASPSQRSARQSRAIPTQRAVAAASPTGQTTFVPITPCRIADTRGGGGALSAGATRTFQVTGTAGFLEQGGHSGGCGIPAAAQAVSLALTATAQTSAGHVTVYPNGAALPLASMLAFTRGVNITSAVQAAVGTGGRLRANLGSSGSAQLVLDVTGYYVGSLWAEVGGAGTVIAGSRVTSVTHGGTGDYRVFFDQDVSSCAYSVVPVYSGGVFVTAQPVSSGVAVNLKSGTDVHNVDSTFYVVVTC